MAVADPFTMASPTWGAAMGTAVRKSPERIDGRAAYEGPLPDPRLPPAWMLAAGERPRGWLTGYLKVGVVGMALAALVIAGLVAF